MKSSLKVSLKKIDTKYIEFLWCLRNKPYVRKYSLNKKRVNWEEHVNWILPILMGISNKELYIILYNSAPVGQVRFDYSNNDVEISISIFEEFQGKRIASASLTEAIKKSKKDKKIVKLIARINKNNLSSLKLFEKAGFKYESKDGSWFKYHFHLHD